MARQNRSFKAILGILAGGIGLVFVPPMALFMVVMGSFGDATPPAFPLWLERTAQTATILAVAVGIVLTGVGLTLLVGNFINKTRKKVA